MGPALVHATAPSTQASETYLDELELAAWIGASLEIQAWRRGDGGPRFVKVGPRLVYARRDVEAWLAANTHSKRRRA